MPFTKLDPLKEHTGTLSGGSLTVTATAGSTGAYGLLAHAQRSGTAVFEVTLPTAFSGVGIVHQITDLTEAIDSGSHNNIGSETMYVAGSNGHQVTRGSDNGLLAATAANDTIMFALDFDNKKWYAQNVTQGTGWNPAAGGTPDPDTNSGGFAFPTSAGNGEAPGNFVPFVLFASTGQNATFNFGDTAFVGTPPSTFTPGWAQAAGSVQVEYQNQVVTGSGTVLETLDVTTGGADRVILLHITTGSSSGSAATVSSITDTAGLTWAKRASNDLNFSGGNHTGMELWWAHATSQLTADTITVNLGASSTGIAIIAMSVRGANNPAAPFDTDGSLPATPTHAGGASVPTASVSTASAAGSVFQFLGTANFTLDPTVNLTWQSLGPAVAAGSVATYEQAGYSAYSSALASASITGGVSFQPWSMIVDAIPASTTPSGTWASTETPDTMAALGYHGSFGVIGNLTATETADGFAAAGFVAIVGTMILTEAKDSFNARGSQPIAGTFIVTEAPDRMVAHGIGLGEDGVMHITELPDIFSAFGSTPIVGSFNTTENPDQFRAFGAGVTFGSQNIVVTFTT